MSRPTVSVIIPTYNRANLLPRALDSVIAQSYPNWEIVVADDGSTDDTAEVVSGFQRRLGARLLYARRNNAGASAARNHGIDVSRGVFVAFLDSDDEFQPTKLERQLELFNRCPELGLVYGDSAFVDLEGVRHPSVFDEKAPMARRVPSREIAPGLRVCTEPLFDWLIRDYFIATIAGMVRRGVLGDTIRFPTDLRYAEEWLFYLKIARTCPAGFVDEPLCLHHFVSGSLARSDKRANMLGMRAMLRRIASEFPDLTAPQRRSLRLNQAAASRQLAYEAHRSRRHGDAALYFIECFRYEPSLRRLLDAARSSIRSALGSVTRRRSKATAADPRSCGLDTRASSPG